MIVPSAESWRSTLSASSLRENPPHPSQSPGFGIIHFGMVSSWFIFGEIDKLGNADD
jgi:hypothetical protein